MSEKTKMAIARRAVACPGWRWMPGMRATWPDDGRPARRYGSPGETAGWISDYSGKERSIFDAHALPDFDDPATLGCLLALVRETYGHKNTYAGPVYDYGHWSIWRCRTWKEDVIGRRTLTFDGPTEAEALVAALEAAGGAG